jgi:hypothetical protein
VVLHRPSYTCLELIFLTSLSLSSFFVCLSRCSAGRTFPVILKFRTIIKESAHYELKKNIFEIDISVTFFWISNVVYTKKNPKGTTNYIVIGRHPQTLIAQSTTKYTKCIHRDISVSFYFNKRQRVCLCCSIYLFVYNQTSKHYPEFYW